VTGTRQTPTSVAATGRPPVHELYADNSEVVTMLERYSAIRKPAAADLKAP
jgi:hypothetical protein